MLVGGTNRTSIVKSTLDVGSASPMLIDGVSRPRLHTTQCSRVTWHES